MTSGFTDISQLWLFIG